MKKVSLLILVSMILLLAFSSCTLAFKDKIPAQPEEQPTHVHEFGTEWIHDGDVHYHECPCGAESDVAKHQDKDDNGLCDVCAGELPPPNIRYTVSVKATNEDGKPFFGNTLLVKHGDDAVFDIMVGLEYTLELSDGKIVGTSVADGFKTYTIKVENVTENIDISVSSKLCPHSWLPATCEAPAICLLCGITDGEPNGHTWADATCTDPKTCSVCAKTEGEALGHTPGAEATCTTAQSCTVCQAELTPALGHTPGAEATCTTAQSCTVCQAELTPALGHTEGEAVVENNVAPTCTVDGSYDSVVYCTVCNAELSRETVVVDKLGHTEGEAVVENSVAPTCTVDGSYDSVVYCSVCSVELSRETIVVDKLGHTKGEAVVENSVAPDCDDNGSYDSVVYCTVCNAELSRTTVTVDKLGHTEGKPVEENYVAPDCVNKGSIDTVVYCTVCSVELSRVTNEISAVGHNPGEVVVENNLAPDCDDNGSYDNVVYCTVCESELSRVTVTVDKLGHTNGAVVVENNVDPTCTENGSYDNVVYCTVCEIEVSRVTVTVAAKNHTPGAAATCTAPQTCTVCGAELAEALGHTYSTDWTYDETNHWHECHCGAIDEASVKAHTLSEKWTYDASGHWKDCECGYTTAPQPHVEAEDDGDCSTPIRCADCQVILILGTNHSFSSEWVNDDAEGHYHVCTNEGCTKNDGIAEHISSGPATEEHDEECIVCHYIIAPSLTHVHDFNIPKFDGDNHWLQCRCGEKSEVTAHTAKADDGDCTTAVTCTGCDHIMVAAKADHEAGADDGNCTTDIKCKNCDKVAVPGAEKHTEVIDEAVAPGCESTGLTEGKHCEVCGMITKAQQIVSATGHKYTAVVTPPTCTEKGYTTYTCSCGDTYTSNEADVIPHTYNAVVTAPTCTEKGYTTYTCSCGDSYVDDEEPATGHIYTNKCDTTCNAPGCTETRAPEHTPAEDDHNCTTATLCTVCGATLDEVKQHVFDNSCDTDCNNTGCEHTRQITHTPGAEATCLTNQICTVCKVELVDALGHNEQSHAAKDPTCTEVGWDAYVTCSRCNYTTYVEKAALDHDRQSHAAKTPTCTEIGWDAYETCSRCSYTTYVEKAALDHDRQSHAAKDPTCTEIGWDAYETCSRCSYTTYVEKAALDHDRQSHAAKTPTCTEIGWDAYVTCSRCSYTTYVEKGKLDHTSGEVVRENEKSASCTASGSYDEVVYCTVCENELSRTPVTVDPTSHIRGTEVRENIVAATCTTEGSYDLVVRCTACPKELSRTHVTTEKDPNAHAPAAAVEENRVEATCVATGSYDSVVYCSRCNVQLERTSHTISINPNAHTPAVAVRENVVDSTCYAEGSYDSVVYCSVEACHKELSRTSGTIEKKAHTSADAVRENVVDSTCYAEGSYDSVVYCSVEACHEELSRTSETIVKKAHTSADAVRENVVDSTCYAEGSYDSVVYCSVEACHEELSRTSETIAKKAHTSADAVRENVVPATCSATGSYDSVVYCSVAECKVQLSRTHETIAIDDEAHTEADPVEENRKGATCTTAETYESVVKCSGCDVELSRTTVTVGSALGHVWISNGIGADCDRCDATGYSSGWQLVTDASTLSAGDKIIIVSSTKGKIALSTIHSKGYLTNDPVTVTDDVIDALPDGALVLTLGGTNGAWTLSNSDGKLLGATAVKQLAWDKGTTTWSITIADNAATIQNGTASYGRFLYNVNDPRFTTYTSDTNASMLLPQIFALNYVECTSHTDATTTVDPTCTTDGSKTTYCTACGYVSSVVTIPAEHTMSTEWTKGTENHYYECTAEGCEHIADVAPHEYGDDFTCDICGYVSHTHTCESIMTPPTCISKGYTTYSCTGCDYSYIDDYVDETGVHTDADGNLFCDITDCNAEITPAADSTITIAQALILANRQANESYTTNKYYITGTVKSIANQTFGNPTIYDDEGNELYIFGLYGTDNETQYGSLVYKPVKGDVITVYTVLGLYDNAPQGKYAILYSYVAHEHSYVDSVTDPTCLADGFTTHTCSICDDSYTDTPTEALGHTTDNGTCERCGNTIGGDEPTVETEELSYTFAEYTAGTQYADNEAHKLDDTVTVTTTDCHFTTQLRIYSSSTYNGYAIIHSTKSISAISVNAGNKVDNLNVYVSTDGITWSLAGSISVTSTSYKDYSLDLDTTYNYLKLDVEGDQQIRIASMKLTVITSGSSEGGETPEHTCTSVCSECGKCTDDACTEDACQEKCEGHSATTTISKATSIAVGDIVYLVYEGSSKEFNGISTTSTKYGIGTDYSGTPSGLIPLTVVKGYTDDTFAFQTSDGKYLYWSSGNSLNVNATLNANTSWTVTFDTDGNAVIKNAKDSTRQIMWNASSPRFACYTGTQTAIQLYKQAKIG